jgi:hypothetical protein
MELLEKLLQYYILYMWWFWVETWRKKGLIQCYAYTNVANRFVFSFVWRKFSSVGIGEWWDELKNGQKLKLGDAPEAPLLHRQKSGHLSTHYIFIASCIIHFSWSTICYSFQFFLFLFAAINGLTPTNFFWRSCLAFHLPRTLRFSLLSFQRVFSFSRTAFSFQFLPWFMFRSCYIFASMCIFVSGPCWFSSKELL